ncbi:MAG: ester cyclase [Actinomycetota bacterium]|nr:ester cyclase [Actinomycetota bacterium]
MTADGDKVSARARLTGTHQGEFMGVPATGSSSR